jgi:WD40 repeat protein
LGFSTRTAFKNIIQHSAAHFIHEHSVFSTRFSGDNFDSPFISFERCENLQVTSMEFTQLTSVHDDVVHDIAFDYYGRRFATCASDKRIKVWDLDNETSDWKCYDIQRAHNDSIWRLSWSHPEFGQLIASCSEDKTICVWEEQESVNPLKTDQRDRWQRKVQISDSKKSVNDVKFAPRHLGLKLAAGSADGTVRIYEATDVFSLNYWQQQVSAAICVLFIAVELNECLLLKLPHDISDDFSL